MLYQLGIVPTYLTGWASFYQANLLADEVMFLKAMLMTLNCNERCLTFFSYHILEQQENSNGSAKANRVYYLTKCGREYMEM